MASSGLRCGDALSGGAYRRLLRRAIFDCCKWHVQQGDEAVLSPFPLIVEPDTWQALAGLAEALEREARAAEDEIRERPELLGRLGLSPRLLRVLRADARPTPEGPRLSRYDFHPTNEGLRISEGNIDVAGGLVEASGVTALMAAEHPALVPAGDPAGSFAEALATRAGPAGRVGLMHLTRYTEDRQVMVYLARRLAGHGARACLFDPMDLHFRDGRAEADAPLDVVVRFLPADWLERLPAATRWTRAVTGGRTPFANPVSAVLTQSKRFPLVWDDLAASLPTWRALLPETCEPEGVAWEGDEAWVIKPAFGHEGDRVGIAGVTEPDRYREIAVEATRAPRRWAAQRRFAAAALPTPAGPRYPAVGVYVLDGRAAGAYGRLARRPLVDDAAQDVAVLVTRA